MLRHSSYSGGVIHGTLAASVTPLRDGGSQLDVEAIPAIVDFLAASGVDGVLALGTTGEGILLNTAEREQVATAFIDAASDRIDVAVHVGALTTAEAVRLAHHAATYGAEGIAAIGPPYFAYDEAALFDHFREIGRACAPAAFYLYEFEARAGYALPLVVIERLRQDLDNLRGLKVSTTPWEKLSPYLTLGLDAFCGPEALIRDALAHGATGAVSGLAAAFPELVVSHVRQPTMESHNVLVDLRGSLSQYPFQAALKRVLARRGVPVDVSVRRPLRPLTAEERAAVDTIAATAGL